MRAKERQQAVAAYILKQGGARIDELVEVFDVSRMTIHRHIEELARQGVVRKLHGSVSAQPSSTYESLFTFRQSHRTEVKQALARAALDEIEPGDVVLLDDATTTHAILPMLAEKSPLSVVTNSLGMSSELVAMEEISLVCLGGDYHPTYNAFIGHLCENALAGIKVNTLICSASAVEDGLALIQDPQVTRVKQAMMRASRKTVLVIDSDKFGKTAMHMLAPLRDFDLVISDNQLPPATAKALRDDGVRLKQVTLV